VTTTPRKVPRLVELVPLHEQETLLGYLVRLDRFQRLLPARHPGERDLLQIPMPSRGCALYLASRYPQVHVLETSGKEPFFAFVGDTLCLAYPMQPQDDPALCYALE